MKVSRLVTGGLAVVLASLLLSITGCKQKDETTEAAPPPSAGARPEGVNPAKRAKMPGPMAPNGNAPANAGAAGAM